MIDVLLGKVLVLVRCGWRREAAQNTRCKSRDKGGRWNVNDQTETSYDINKRY